MAGLCVARRGGAWRGIGIGVAAALIGWGVGKIIPRAKR